MQRTSDAYKDDMKAIYRGKSHVWINVGLINLDAQESAHITSHFSGSEAHLYDNSSASTVTSTENDGSITFTFAGTENNIAGLTLNFGNTAPSTVTVTNGSKTETYVKGQSNILTIDDGYENCSYLKLTPNSGKLSLSSITFGIGLSFNDASIISTERKNAVSHISNELPTKEFTFVLNNRSHMFNQDNPYGYADYLQEKQVIQFTYGRELTDETDYKIKGGKVRLKNWSSDDYEAKFTCTGLIDFLTDEYKKGKYYPNGITAYALAEDVFEDAGVTDYIIDDSLNNTKFTNPIPPCMHKEALQMIANASMCLLYEDRDGNICLASSQVPSYLGEVTFSGATDYSSTASIFNINSDNYADFEYQYLKADGTRRFFPDTESYLDVGFVSESLSSSGTSPYIEIKFTDKFKMANMYLDFGFDNVSQITFTPYLDGVAGTPQTISSVGIATAITYADFVDKVRITFNSWTTNTRVHLNHIEIQGSPDYMLTKRELKAPAVATNLEKVTNVNVNYYEYSTDDPASKKFAVMPTTFDLYENTDHGLTQDISTDNESYGDLGYINAVEGDNEIRFNDPIYDLTVSAGTIKEQGAYYAVIYSPKAQVIAVNGKYLKVTKNVHTITIHEKGTEKTCDNVLIGNLDMAKQEAVWLRDYYDDDLEFTFSYRGDPSLDADDLIYLENQFVQKNQIRIVEESINTSLGMDFNCGIRARRVFYQTDADIHVAIVGKALVGERLSN